MIVYDFRMMLHSQNDEPVYKRFRSTKSGMTHCIQLERQSFRKVWTVIADGGTRDSGTNIVTVPTISGQLATMVRARLELSGLG